MNRYVIDRAGKNVSRKQLQMEYYKTYHAMRANFTITKDLEIKTKLPPHMPQCMIEGSYLQSVIKLNTDNNQNGDIPTYWL